MCYVWRMIRIFVYIIDPDGHATSFSTAFLDTRANVVMLNKFDITLPLMQPSQHELQHFSPIGGKLTALKIKSKFRHPIIKLEKVQSLRSNAASCCIFKQSTSYLLHFPFSPAHIYQTDERVLTGCLQDRKYFPFPLINVASLMTPYIFSSRTSFENLQIVCDNFTLFRNI